MEELPYQLPVELDKDCINLYAKMRNYVPGLIDTSVETANEVNSLNLNKKIELDASVMMLTNLVS